MQGTRPAAPGHVFISYVREDEGRVVRLQQRLEDAGITVWRDRGDLGPGQDWQIEIRKAIKENCRAFLACFSEKIEARETSYQYVELNLAAEEVQNRPAGDTWLIPVRFADCKLPFLDLGAGRTLYNLQHVDLFGNSSARNLSSLINVLRERLGTPDLLPKGKVFWKGRQGRRVRGSQSLADARNWLLCAMLGVTATVGTAFAFLGWPDRCVEDVTTLCRYEPVPGRGACFLILGLSLAVIASSLAEGPRARRPARWIRLITSLAGGLGLSGLAAMPGS